MFMVTSCTTLQRPMQSKASHFLNFTTLLINMDGGLAWHKASTFKRQH